MKIPRQIKKAFLGQVRVWLIFLLVSVPCSSFADWPRFLGPSNDLRPEQQDARRLGPQAALTKAWVFDKGKGWATPIVVGDSVLVFHRLGSDEVLDCLDARSGSPKWRYSYDSPYRDRFGTSDGVRSSPVVDGERVFLFGVTGQLHCVGLASGSKHWVRDLKKDYGMRDNFFGHGSSPLVVGEKVIVPLGGEGQKCVGAFDVKSGSELWIAKHEWGAGYASLVPVSIQTNAGLRNFVLLFTGGETRPPTGGLICVDAASGEVLGVISHRARIAESVNAASPVLVGERRVLVTEGYGAGSLLVEIRDDGSLVEVWRTTKLGSQFGTPVSRGGLIFGFDGQNPRLAELVCLDAQTGGEHWRDDLGGKFGRGSFVDLGSEGLLAIGESGGLIFFKDEGGKFKVLKSSSLFDAPETWAGPAVAGGRLFVSQNERARGGESPRVICFTW
jgi:outer membrane protein assembly factor BamB